MPRMTGGDAIVDSLLRHGIDTVFGLPGVQLYGLFDAFARQRDRLRLIHARHEQTAAYMAVGAATSTGRPAVYAVAPGPGVLNTTAALATAWGLNAPVLCLAGQVPGAMIGRRRGALHELPDQLATLGSLVKYAARIEHPAEAPGLVARAFQEMRSGRPGPAVLEMPMDQFGAVAEVRQLDPLALPPPPPVDAGAIERAAALVAGARAPMIWVGGGARDAAREILALAERIGAPVVSLRTGRGIVDDDHPLGLTVPAAHALWPETDLVLGFGTRLDVPLQRWGEDAPRPSIVRVDIDPAEQRRLKVELFVLADAAAAAGALAAAVASRHDAGRAAAIAAAKASGAAAALQVQPQVSFLAAIRAALPRHGILCDEMTQAGYSAWFGFPVHQPRDLITSGFSGTLGAGFPMALGVKVANAERPVVALTGDGGFLYAAAELATARHHGIALVTVLFNNGAYGNVLRDQRRLFDGREAGAVLTNPDFQAFARSFGVPSWRVEDAGGLGAALREALATGTPALIEVMTDASREASPWEVLFPARR